MNRAAIADPEGLMDTLRGVCSGSPCTFTEGLGGEVWVKIEAGQLRAAVQALIERHEMRHLSAITAQLRPETVADLQSEKGGAVEVLYHFWQRGGLTLQTRAVADLPVRGVADTIGLSCPGDAPADRSDLSSLHGLTLPSLVDLSPAADWYEREVHDLFGVEFAGHPHLKPLLLPDDWTEPPPMLDLGEER